MKDLSLYYSDGDIPCISHSNRMFALKICKIKNAARKKKKISWQVLKYFCYVVNGIILNRFCSIASRAAICRIFDHLLHEKKKTFDEKEEIKKKKRVSSHSIHWRHRRSGAFWCLLYLSVWLVVISFSTLMLNFDTSRAFKYRRNNDSFFLSLSYLPPIFFLNMRSLKLIKKK